MTSKNKISYKKALKAWLAIGLPVAAFMVSCSSHDSEDLVTTVSDGSEVSLYSRAAGNGAEVPRIFLWNDDDYLSLIKGTTTSVRPVAERIAANTIDDFNYNPSTNTGTALNTFYKYPDVTSYIYATGIAPSAAFPMNISTNYDNQTEFSIIDADYQQGLTDFLSTINDGSSRGRGAMEDHFIEAATIGSPLITQNEERELKFQHLTAAIGIVATRDESTYEKIGVKDITVRILNDTYTDEDGTENEIPDNQKLAVPTSIKYYQKGSGATYDEYGAIDQGTNQNPNVHAWTYISGDETSNIPAFEASTPYTINMGENLLITTFYVNSKGIEYGESAQPSLLFDPLSYTKETAADDGTIYYKHKLNLPAGEKTKTPTLYLEVEYTIYYPNTNVPEERLKKSIIVKDDSWNTTDLSDAVSTGSRFLPGYYYQITLKFKPQGIALQAELLPWQEIGPYYYSVWGTTPSTETGGNSGQD